MSTYAIGDIHGCYITFQKLLAKINFDPAKDYLWLTGDLINRGKQSLEVLRLVKSMSARVSMVLGNHEFYLFALKYGAVTGNFSHLQQIIDAHDGDELMEWLALQPLVHTDKNLKYVMTHAGIPPMWDLTTTQNLANEISEVMQNETQFIYLLKTMYQQPPLKWDQNLSGQRRLHTIIHYLTKMRFSTQDGILNSHFSGDLVTKPTGSKPWFWHPNKITHSHTILFGHWAALGGITYTDKIHALDSGCVWEKHLTALRLDDESWFRCSYSG